MVVEVAEAATAFVLATECDDFFVVVVVAATAAAIQWRVGKTTAGMTNRALNTNWPASSVRRCAPVTGPHAHAPDDRTRQAHTIDFFRFPPSFVPFQNRREGELRGRAIVIILHTNTREQGSPSSRRKHDDYRAR